MAIIKILDFDMEMERLVHWFKAQIRHQHSEQIYQKIKTWPIEALRGAADYLIENKKPMPGNFPTINELRAAMTQWLSDHPEFRNHQIEYDKYEDHRFPVRHLEKALNILTRRGQEPFTQYCNAVNMPIKDRERVINKARAAYPMSKVKDMIGDAGKGV
jgi:hypothetical protein